MQKAPIVLTVTTNKYFNVMILIKYKTWNFWFNFCPEFLFNICYTVQWSKQIFFTISRWGTISDL